MGISTEKNSMRYFIKRGEKVQGPFTREQLLGFAKAKKVKAADLVGNSAEGPFQELKTIWSSISGSTETAQTQHQNTGLPPVMTSTSKLQFLYIPSVVC